MARSTSRGEGGARAWWVVDGAEVAGADEWDDAVAAVEATAAAPDAAHPSTKGRRRSTLFNAAAVRAWVWLSNKNDAAMEPGENRIKNEWNR